MFENNKNEPILSRMSKILDETDFENIKISPEGYGSFFKQDPTKHQPLLRAIHLKSKAESINNMHAIPLHLESFFAFLRVNEELNSNNLGQYLSKLKFIMKYLDSIIEFIISIDERSFLPCLEWARFNLQLYKLLKDGEFITSFNNPGLFKHTIDSIKILEEFFNKNNTDAIEITKPGLIEAGIKKRMPK